MSHRVGFLAVLFALAFAGCGGNDSADSGPEVASATRTCPNGEDRRAALRDLDANFKGETTPADAVEVFLRQKGGDANSEDFEPVDGTQDERDATFAYSDGEFELARLYVKQFERGWIVISYEYCQGAI